MAGIYAHHFSVITALCDGSAYLLSVAALSSPPPRRVATHLLHLCSYNWLSRPVPVCAVDRFRTRASGANVHKRAEPSQRLRQLGHGDTQKDGLDENRLPTGSGREIEELRFNSLFGALCTNIKL